MKIITTIFLLFFLQSCYTNDNASSKEISLPNDVRWVTNSSEYSILCKQIYKNAWQNLSQTLKNSDSAGCIIMDLDETVLDNSKYQIGLAEKNETYNPESWSKWVNLKEANLVPGAKDFIDKVRQTNVKIIYLSNRMAKNEIPTMKNMVDLGIYEEDDIFLLRIDKPDKKDVRRSEVLNGTGRMVDFGPLNVLAYFGDARHDFEDPNSYFSFGENMFMFPNPMYGKW